MKKRILSIVAISVWICFCFSGCQLTILSANELIRPPKLSGESSFLQEAFEKTINKEHIEMKTPINGENRSSYIIYDIDADGNDDGLVFYSDPTVDEFAHVAVFKHDGNDWKNISNFVGLAEEVYEVSFNDVNGDGKKEVLISWSSLGPDSYTNETLTLVGNRNLALYSFNGNTMTLQKTENYTKMYVSDFDKDGSDDLFFTNVNISIDSNKTTAHILSFDKNYSIDYDSSFDLVGMLDVMSIVSDTVNSANNLTTRIYIDGLLSESAYITDVVEFNSSNNNYSLPFHSDSETTDVPPTVRSSKVFCADIDSDGVVEIPTVQELPYSKRITENIDENSALNLIVWSQFDSQELNVDFKSLYNKAKNYYFVFDENWISNITAVYNNSNSLLTFYSVKNGEIGDKLFSIMTFSSSAWAEDKNNFDLLYDGGAYVYGYSLNASDEFSKQDILNNFFTMS